MDTKEDAGDNVKQSVSQVVVIHVVGEAQGQFCESLIKKSFLDVRLNIALDGLEDSKLPIKGYEHRKLEIGDWRLEIGCKSTTVINSINKEAGTRQASVKPVQLIVLIQESKTREERREEGK